MTRSARTERRWRTKQRAAGRRLGVDPEAYLARAKRRRVARELDIERREAMRAERAERRRRDDDCGPLIFFDEE